MVRLEEHKNEYGRPPFSAQPHPWLVILHGQKMQKQTFFSISENRYYERTIPELRYIDICAYAQEWLVLLNYHSEDCYLWNPITEDKIQLPPLPKYNRLRCLLSAPPHDPECRVVFLINGTSDDNTEDDDDDDDDDEEEEEEEEEEDDTLPILYFCKPGYNTEFHKQDLQLPEDDDHLHSWTIFNGKIYGLTTQMSILVISDLDHESGLVKIQLNQPIYGDRDLLDMPNSRRYLIQFNDNELLYIHQRYFDKDRNEVYAFQVFRFDFEENSWVKVESIGETAIFLHDSTGMSCSTRDTNLDKDTIYYTEHADRHLYVFNLKTNRILRSLPCQHVSKKYSSLCWLPL